MAVKIQKDLSRRSLRVMRTTEWSNEKSQESTDVDEIALAALTNYESKCRKGKGTS